MIVVDVHGTPHRVDNRESPDYKIRPDCKICAKNTGTRYLVLASSSGDLFDPTDSNNNINKRNKERGAPFWQLQRCSEECYKLYTSFLRTRNRTPLLIAQRRFRNDF